MSPFIKFVVNFIAFFFLFLPQSTSAPGSPSIKDEPLDTSQVENEMKTEESEFDPDAIIQDKTNEDIEDPFRHKPKLRNRKLQELPIAEKGLDYSSLCSIM